MVLLSATGVGYKKMRPRSDAATDGDRWGRVIDDGGPDQARVEPNPALLRLRDSRTYPQAGPAGRLLAALNLEVMR